MKVTSRKQAQRDTAFARTRRIEISKPIVRPKAPSPLLLCRRTAQFARPVFPAPGAGADLRRAADGLRFRHEDQTAVRRGRNGFHVRHRAQAARGRAGSAKRGSVMAKHNNFDTG